MCVPLLGQEDSGAGGDRARHQEPSAPIHADRSRRAGQRRRRQASLAIENARLHEICFSGRTSSASCVSPRRSNSASCRIIAPARPPTSSSTITSRPTASGAIISTTSPAGRTDRHRAGGRRGKRNSGRPADGCGSIPRSDSTSLRRPRPGSALRPQRRDSFAGDGTPLRHVRLLMLNP